MTDQALTILDHDPAGALDLAGAGQAANAAASRWAFADYRSRKAANTLRVHDAALNAFAEFFGRMRGAPVTGQALAGDPAAWRGLTWGIVEAWKVAMLQAGYSVATINNRLSVIRVYAELAGKAGAIAADDLTLISAVAGYGMTEGKRVDERRPVSRVGAKKAEPVSLTLDQARRLKRPQDDTGQAARDSLIFCLLLDQGLRLSEVAGLTPDALDLDQGLMTFYRSKVDKVQTHRMTADTLTAARRYLTRRPAVDGRLFVASDRRGRLLARAMSARAIAKRVNLLGELAGAVGLSPHDCRHYWATTAAAAGTGVFSLRDAGGWSSVAMPARYVGAAAIANEGVILYQ